MVVTMDADWADAGTQPVPTSLATYVVDKQPVAEYDNWFNYSVVNDIQAVIDDVINRYGANTILKADVANTPLALTVAEQTLIGRKTGSSIDALDQTDVLSILDSVFLKDGSRAATGDFDLNGFALTHPTFLYPHVMNGFTILNSGSNTIMSMSDAIGDPITVNREFAMSARKITGLGDPTAAQDAATKAWVDAHNWAAGDITSGTLPVGRGGTGVTGDTYDADKVDGCHAGTGLADVFKLYWGSYWGGLFVVNDSGGEYATYFTPGTDGYQLTTHGNNALPTWAAASDLIFSDTHCPKCGLEFQDGDNLILHVIGHNECDDILTIPMHLACAAEPKKTVTIKRKVFENRQVIDEDTGELKIQRVQKIHEKLVTKHRLKEGYTLDGATGKVHKLNKDGKTGKTQYGISTAMETVEETVSEAVMEDVEYIL